MPGILSWGAYLPYRRLDRSQIAPLVGQGGGKGTRTVASFDEDPTTMAVEAGRNALGATSTVPDLVLFGSVTPAYADKTNATGVHAALRLPDSTAAFDLGSSTRSSMGGLLLALRSTGTTLVTAGDVRTGLAGSAEEAAGGDGAGAVLVGDGTSGAPVLAEVVGTASTTAEFIDRWRTPGESRSKVWDDKYAEITYRPLALQAWSDALAAAGVEASDVALAAVSAPSARIAASIAGRLGAGRTIDDLAASAGNTGAAQPLVLLASLLEQAEPGQLLALVSAADGADVVLLRATDALAAHHHPRTIAEQVASGGTVSYGRFLAWRQVLAVEPPRRPEPPRVSATAAARAEEWKFGFVGSRDQVTGKVHLPPARVSDDGTRTDQMDPAPMADVQGTIVTFTIDRVAYSPSPPIVFAVVDFDGGGRLPVELCDLDADEVRIGAKVEMTFRRLSTADGIPNYFWKARLVREPAAKDA